MRAACPPCAGRVSTEHSSTQGLSWGSAPTPWYSQQRAHVPLLFHPQTKLFPALLEVPAPPPPCPLHTSTSFPRHWWVGEGGEGMRQPVLSTAFTLAGQHAHTHGQLAAS